MRLQIRQMFMLVTAGFLGLTLSSCSKGDCEPEYQKPMEFSGYTARSVTKANGSFVTGTQLPTNQYFGVYAYNTGTSDTFDPDQINAQNNPYVKFMTDVAVQYKGGQNMDDATLPSNYPYSPMRYWPNTEESNRLAFFAYYPYNGAGITRNGFADFTFTVQEAPADQIDFMLTDVIQDQRYSHTNSGTAGVVNMPFNHMLTQVRFKGKTDAPEGVKVKVNELKVVDVKSKGVLKPAINAVDSDWPEANLSENKTFVITLNDDNLTSEAAAIANDDQTLLMIPQPLAGCKLRVTYTITPPAPALTITQTAVLDLATSDISVWNKRQQIVYTLNIGLHFIDFSASLENWSDGPGESIEVE